LIGGDRKSVGMKRLIRRMDLRTVKATDLTWLGRDFERYLFEDRLPNMWRNQGVVRGRYGKGSKRWAKNAPSTIKGKGFDKAMHSGRQRFSSSMARRKFEAYEYGFSHRRRSKRARNSNINFKLNNTVEHAKHLHKGRSNMPARWVLGFIDGDGEWLRRHAADDIMVGKS